MKEVAPSTELRKWFNQDPSWWDEFHARYFAELDNNGELIADLFEAAHGKPVLLLFGARNLQHNNAVALKEYLLKQPRR